MALNLKRFASRRVHAGGDNDLGVDGILHKLRKILKIQFPSKLVEYFEDDKHYEMEVPDNKLGITHLYVDPDISSFCLTKDGRKIPIKCDAHADEKLKSLL